MIKNHSDDPDVAAAAEEAAHIVRQVLNRLPEAKTFDYGGHQLHLDEYGMCVRCTSAIAEAQHGAEALHEKAEATTDQTIAEHLQLAADLLRAETQAAIIRAELHSGQKSEGIVNEILAFIYHRNIQDSYDHNHNGDSHNG